MLENPGLEEAQIVLSSGPAAREIPVAALSGCPWLGGCARCTHTWRHGLKRSATPQNSSCGKATTREMSRTIVPFDHSPPSKMPCL
eukprot:3393184-Amphidinium_carterae.1